MRHSIVLTGFTQYSNVNLENLGNIIVTSLNGNTNYTTPTPTLPVFSEALQQFSAALLAAQNGDKLKIEERNAARKALELQLRQLASYVNLVSGGDRAIQKSSGFPLNAQQGTPAGGLGPVKNVRLSFGKNSGDIIVRYQKVEAAVSYEIDFAISPVQNNAWTTERDNVTKHLLTGLTRGQEYAIRVRAVGPGGETVVSDIVTILVI